MGALRDWEGVKALAGRLVACGLGQRQLATRPVAMGREVRTDVRDWAGTRSTQGPRKSGQVQKPEVQGQSWQDPHSPDLRRQG